MDQLVTPLLAAGGIVGLFVATGVVLLQLLQSNDQLRKQRDDDLATVKEDRNKSIEAHRRCERNLSRLVAVLLRNGLDIPPEIFE